MTRSLLVLLLCGCCAWVQAAPIEDEPLPFDTRMPPRTVAPAPAETAQSDAPRREAAPASEVRQKCRTVTRKVHGRRVKQKECTRVREAVADNRRSRHETRAQSRRHASAKPSARERQRQARSTARSHQVKKATHAARKRR